MYTLRINWKRSVAVENNRTEAALCALYAALLFGARCITGGMRLPMMD